MAVFCVSVPIIAFTCQDVLLSKSYDTDFIVSMLFISAIASIMTIRASLQIGEKDDGNPQVFRLNNKETNEKVLVSNFASTCVYMYAEVTLGPSSCCFDACDCCSIYICGFFYPFQEHTSFCSLFYIRLCCSIYYSVLMFWIGVGLKTVYFSG